MVQICTNKFVPDKFWYKFIGDKSSSGFVPLRINSRFPDFYVVNHLCQLFLLLKILRG
jgi:hypothetical protein